MCALRYDIFMCFGRAARASKEVIKCMIYHRENSSLKKELREILPSIIDPKFTSDSDGVAPVVDVKRGSGSTNYHHEGDLNSTVEAEGCATNNSMMSQLSSIGRSRNAKFATSPPISSSFSSHISSNTNRIGDNIVSMESNVSPNRRGKHLKNSIDVHQKR